MKKFFGIMLALSIVLALVSSASAANVTLAWDPTMDPAVTGYKLYMGTASRIYGTPVDVGKVTQYVLTNVPEGVTVYFAVTAYDSSRNESAFSAELKCFTIVALTPTGGTITPSTVVLSVGMSQLYSFTPIAPNNAVANVLVDGTSVGPVTKYLFSNVTACHTVNASFKTETVVPPSTEVINNTPADYKQMTTGVPAVTAQPVTYLGNSYTGLVFSGISNTAYTTYERSLATATEKRYYSWTFYILGSYDPNPLVKKSYFIFYVKTDKGDRYIQLLLEDGIPGVDGNIGDVGYPIAKGTSSIIKKKLGSCQAAYNNGIPKEVTVDLVSILNEAQGVLVTGKAAPVITSMVYFRLMVAGVGPTIVAW